jgi:hypothetical protein
VDILRALENIFSPHFFEAVALPFLLRHYPAADLG